MEFGHASKEKQQTTHVGRSRTTKSSRNQNARKKRRLIYWGILENDTMKLAEMKEKILKRASQKNLKITRNKTL